jgi:hypothetical protein
MFKPSSPLASSKTYSATITTGVKDLAGNALVGTTKWTFTTTATTTAGATTPPAGTTTTEDTTPPKVVSVTPRNGATGVQFSSPITATFSEPIMISSLNPGSFYAQALPSLSRIPGMVTLSADGKTVKLEFGFQVPSPWFIIVITPEVRDLKGNAMTTSAAWAFSTVSAPPVGSVAGPSGDTTPPKVVSVTPANGATGIQFSSPITATFSELISGSTVNPTTFYVEALPSHSPIPGMVMLGPDGKTARFQPPMITGGPSHLLVVIIPNVRDINGNAMAAPFVWSYKIASTP